MSIAPRPATEPPPAFERVVERHGRALLRFCAAQVGPEHAEDCFQETMLAALRAYRDLRDGGAVRAWLFAIAARKALDVRRERARAPDAAGEAELEALPAAQEPEPPDEALWARVRRLPAKQQQALSLRYLGDLTHREIAGVMRTSEEAARRSVFEGLTRLRRELAP